MPKRIKWLITLVVWAVFAPMNIASADQVGVRYAEGLLHGFVVLRTLDGKTLATGDATQTAAGDRVTSKLALKFSDGSVHEETTVFSQHDAFQLIKYHLIQKGPAFKRQLETSIDVASGQISVRYTEDNGEEKVLNERLQLEPDVANGMVPILLKNSAMPPSPMTVSMVATTPKPRIVKLAISPQGEEPFSVGGSNRKAMHWVVKVEIGGVAGVVAPLVGKQPPDIHVWILTGEAPVFLKSEGPLYEGGPIWRIEQISPVWPRKSRADSSKH
jgi:hypothetical protein